MDALSDSLVATSSASEPQDVVHTVVTPDAPESELSEALRIEDEKAAPSTKVALTEAAPAKEASAPVAKPAAKAKPVAKKAPEAPALPKNRVTHRMLEIDRIVDELLRRSSDGDMADTIASLKVIVKRAEFTAGKLCAARKGNRAAASAADKARVEAQRKRDAAKAARQANYNKAMKLLGRA